MKLENRLEQVIQNCTRFYQSRTPGHFLVNCHVPFKDPPFQALYDFDLDQHLESYLDYQLEIARQKWNVKADVADDSVPSICPRFGIAEHSAWLGQPVRLQAATCLPDPILHCAHDLEKLKLSCDSAWFQYMKRGYDHLRKRKDGTFLLSVRGTMAPMDIANALRGNAFFTDVVLQPDFLHRLLQFLVNAIHWYYHYLLRWSDTIAGGNVIWMSESWMPENTLAHISNDAAMLCSSAVYEEFGFPYEKELIRPFEYVLYHIHNEKMHYVPRLAEQSPLSLLQVSHDPNSAHPIEQLPEILSMTGCVNLMLDATSDQIRTYIHELKSRNVFLKVWCEDEKDAKDILQFIRSHSGS